MRDTPRGPRTRNVNTERTILNGIRFLYAKLFRIYSDKSYEFFFAWRVTLPNIGYNGIRCFDLFSCNFSKMNALVRSDSRIGDFLENDFDNELLTTPSEAASDDFATTMCFYFRLAASNTWLAN
ncbi:hypothetical protein HZH66_005442 [Vespula vulgaris]|uniref:Uncharacterized protein n=1 Tax=Vespula vulgaris TaxID=7454 RepID=A0A834K557_VESVU|nr:hypothetical protein HZH66_005442 [Vespula vulgaris]